MKNNTIRKSGFTLVEIMIVVAIIGLLASIAVPNFVRARTSSRRSVCIANLKKIADSKVTWSMDNNKSGLDAPEDVDLFGPTNYLRQRPKCPSGGQYDLTDVNTKPTCTFQEIEGHSL